MTRMSKAYIHRLKMASTGSMEEKSADEQFQPPPPEPVVRLRYEDDTGWKLEVVELLLEEAVELKLEEVVELKLEEVVGRKLKAVVELASRAAAMRECSKAAMARRRSSSKLVQCDNHQSDTM